MRAIILLAALLFAGVATAPVPAVAETTAPIVLAQKGRPSPACESNRRACMSGSARTGNFGARYVPPDAVAMCQEAYRRCIGKR